jgi:hypothetical protein
MPQQSKRHHFVPKAYLNAFRDEQGKVLVYRKDAPSQPLHQSPDATQFRRYYYSQPTPNGGRDHNTLEGYFSTVETPWPETVARLHQRADVNDRLENIFQFMALQRARVPASRDASEAMLAQTVKNTMRVLVGSGKLPQPPAGLDPDDVDVAIDPHKSIHSMAVALQGISELFSRLGFAAVHNSTALPFLTSDNPVLWFDPTKPFSEQRPYTIDRDGGAILLFFPVSPKLALVGATSYKAIFSSHGLLHSDVPEDGWVEQMNAQVCRFGYEAVIAQRHGQEALVAEFANVSPVHESISVPAATGLMTVHRQVFGERLPRPKWKSD